MSELEECAVNVPIFTFYSTRGKASLLGAQVGWRETVPELTATLTRNFISLACLELEGMRNVGVLSCLSQHPVRFGKLRLGIEHKGNPVFLDKFIRAEASV